MKTNVVDVLLYMFEHYDDIEIEDSGNDSTMELAWVTETRRLEETLANEGFGETEIEKAIAWLDDLGGQLEELEAYTEKNNVVQSDAIRIYAEDEEDALGDENINFLQYLENVGVLQPMQRELIVERVMALDVAELDLEQFQWMMLMVFANQPGQDEAFAWIEELLYRDEASIPS